MLNEKQDLISSIPGNAEILCASITFLTGRYDSPDRQVNSCYLKRGYDEREYQLFLCSLDQPGYVDEDSIVWFKDGSWLERIDITGMEVWHHASFPKIPDHLR